MVFFKCRLFSPVPRNKNDPPDRPILWSLSTLFCYHQGTAIKGSFLITVARIPRTILKYIYNTLKDKVRQLSHAYCTGCLTCRKVSHWKTTAGPWTGMRTCDSGHSAGSSVLELPSLTRPLATFWSPASVLFMVLFVGVFLPTNWQRWGGEGVLP